MNLQAYTSHTPVECVKCLAEFFFFSVLRAASSTLPTLHPDFDCSCRCLRLIHRLVDSPRLTHRTPT